MFNLKEYALPRTYDEAYEKLIENKNNLILGGTVFLKFSDKNYNTGIDLSEIENVNKIIVQNDEVILGPYVSFKDIEENEFLASYGNSVFKNAIKDVVGTGFKNTVTIGGSVYSKFGFSDVIPVLLALDAKVEFYKAGLMDVKDYAKDEKRIKQDIVTKVIIPIMDVDAQYNSIRKTSGDISIINTVVALKNNKFTIVVGTRPNIAKFAYSAQDYLNSQKEITQDVLDKTVSLIDEDMSFGSNMRASKEYRADMAKVLVKRGIKSLIERRGK